MQCECRTPGRAQPRTLHENSGTVEFQEGGHNQSVQLEFLHSRVGPERHKRQRSVAILQLPLLFELLLIASKSLIIARVIA